MAKKNSKNHSVAHVYAKAIVDSCQSDSELKQIASEIHTVANGIPHAMVSQKVISKLPVLPKTSTILTLILEKKRLPELQTICLLLKEEILGRENAKELKITSAHQMPKNDIEAVKKILSSKMQKKIYVSEEVCEELLGGYILKYDGMMFDTSKRGQLNKIRSCILKDTK